MYHARTRAELLQKTEHEIREEMASALGRVARRLERKLAALEEMRRTLPASGTPARAALVRAFADLRAGAEHDLYCLQVQREAMGLRDHRELLALYRLPAALSPG
jgi:hypothetical protein